MLAGKITRTQLRVSPGNLSMKSSLRGNMQPVPVVSEQVSILRDLFLSGPHKERIRARNFVSPRDAGGSREAFFLGFRR